MSPRTLSAAFRPIFAVATLVALTHGVTAARADEAAAPRVISTSGESVVYVMPDQVTVSLGVQTFNADLDKATAANEEAAARLVKSMTEMGVERKDVQAETLQVSIRYHNGDAPSGISGYMADRLYAIKLRDTKLFDKLVNTALKNGANQLLGFNFESTELRKHRDRARKMAIHAAFEKATDLAKELGCKVGAPRTITEGYMGFVGGFAYRGGYQNMSQNSMQNAGGGGAGDESGSLPLGQLGIRASVNVSFDLIPNEK